MEAKIQLKTAKYVNGVGLVVEKEIPEATPESGIVLVKLIGAKEEDLELLSENKKGLLTFSNNNNNQ